MTGKVDKKPFVLIVEDDPGNRDLTAQQLALLGYETRTVPGGEEALALIERDSPILILMDCNMSGMSGIEASAAIRALPAGGSVPIVGVTADTNDSTREAFLAAGANEVIHRPVLIDGLRMVVARWIAPAARVSLPASTTGVLSRLRGEVGEATVQKIVGMYLDSLDERTAAISAAVAAGDAEALRNSAHALKSATSVLVADYVSDACAELESLGRTGSVEGADTHLQDLLRRADELRTLLETARSAAGLGGHPLIDKR